MRVAVGTTSSCTASASWTATSASSASGILMVPALVSRALASPPLLFLPSQLFICSFLLQRRSSLLQRMDLSGAKLPWRQVRAAGMDLRPEALAATLWHGRKLIVLVTVGVTIGGVLPSRSILTQRPQFTASARLYLGDVNKSYQRTNGREHDRSAQPRDAIEWNR